MSEPYQHTDTWYTYMYRISEQLKKLEKNVTVQYKLSTSIADLER